ncbi:MAG: hypothetical protein MZW92_72995 [Comamonadaceae bacterium]|nr:hypothetical protein [Comamonadaceae bacterium]
MNSSTTLPLHAWRDAIVDIAREAGDVVMAVYATDFAVRGKRRRLARDRGRRTRRGA